MAEYRKLREKWSLLEICRHPELAVEVTLQPVRAFSVDAAILFADILLPLEPMGAPFHFAGGEGPVIEHPVRSAADVDGLRLVDAEESLPHVLEAIRLLRRELDGRTPLIGFAGAPFTLASYLVEGGKSGHYARTKLLMYSDPVVWHQLMAKLAEVVRRFLRAQVSAGAQAVQLFDSWIGALSPSDYRQFVQPHVRHILSDLMTTGVPVIHFGTGTASLLELQRDAGGTVLGIDWRTPLGPARARLGNMAVQGNLDPILLMAPAALLKERIATVLEDAGPLPGHIFNLGHGILPETNPNQVALTADWVHELSPTINSATPRPHERHETPSPRNRGGEDQ